MKMGRTFGWRELLLLVLVLLRSRPAGKANRRAAGMWLLSDDERRLTATSSRLSRRPDFLTPLSPPRPSPPKSDAIHLCVLGAVCLRDPPERELSLTQGTQLHHKWSTPATTSAACSVPWSDLPADRGVTYERRRLLDYTKGMAANTEQLDRWAPHAPCSSPQKTLTEDRRAKAIEKELYKRVDGGSGCAELAAVLQE